MISVDIKALLNRLNASCTQALHAAAGTSLSRQHYEVTLDHLLIQLLQGPPNDFQLIFRQYDVDTAGLLRTLETSLENRRTGNTARPVFSLLLLELFQDAWLTASVELGEPAIRSGALLLALLGGSGRYADPEIWEFLQALPRETLLAQFPRLTAQSSETQERKAGVAGAAPSAGSGGGSALEKYCTDFTRSAQEDKVDPVFGRDREIAQMVDILARRRKNNPILVGEPGVGKTAVVEGLALKVIKRAVPDALKEVSILGLDMGMLQAGASVKGEFENRLKSIIQEIKASPKPIILFIDEAHTMVGAGNAAGGSDAANLLKPALARGELRTIAATTWSEYKQYFEKDPALARRFQPVKLEEPSVADTILILRGLKSKYEESHGVAVRDSAIVAAAELSSRYISGRQLPDKAVDLLDTSAARVKVLLSGRPPAIEEKERELENLTREQRALERDALQSGTPLPERTTEIAARLASLKTDTDALIERWTREKEAAQKLIALRKELHARLAEGETGEPLDVLRASLTDLTNALEAIQDDAPLVLTEVDPDVVAQVVSDWTGIPLGKVLREETAGVLNLETNLRQRVKGQESALTAIAQALRAAKAGVNDPRQPLGIFLLVGPSGVGKTETALAVADLLFGGERFLTTINMSEFQESHSVSRLIGSPPGYVGYGEGGILTEAVRQKPYSVVLLDEVEKAHLDVANLFYQVFDKGSLSDGEGRVIDFKNTVLFLTSNLASDILQKMSASGVPPTEEQWVEGIRPTLSKHFKPALLARMTIVPYRSLAPEFLKEIVALKLQAVAARLFESHRVRLQMSDAVAQQVLARCNEVESGARNIDHILRGTLLPKISTAILSRLSDAALPPVLYVDVAPDGAIVVEDSERSPAISTPSDIDEGVAAR